MGTVPSRVRGGQVAQGLDLVAGDAGGAKRLVGGVEQELGCGIAAEVLAHATMDGGRGLAVQLLVEDRLEQRLEGRGRGIEPHREWSDALDQRGEFRVVQRGDARGLHPDRRGVCGCGS